MCIVNDLIAPAELVKRYSEEGATQIVADTDNINKLGIEVFSAPLAERHNDLIRHNPDKLAEEIMRIFRKKAPTRIFDRRKAL